LPSAEIGLLEQRSHQPTLKLLKELGDRALLTFIVHPKSWPTSGATLDPLLSEIPSAKLHQVLKAPDLWTALGIILDKADNWPKKLDGWDPSRPIVAGFFEPHLDEAVLAARAMLLPTDETKMFVEPVRNRILVPATNSKALLAALVETAAGLELKPSLLVEIKDGAIFELPYGGGFLVLMPGKNFVRIEFIPNRGGLIEDEQIAMMAVQNAMNYKPRVEQLTPTPALLYAATQQQLITIYFRGWMLRDLGSLEGIRKVTDAVRYANPATKAMLLATGLAETGKGYLLASPVGAELDDWAFGFELNNGLRMSAVASLTEQGQKVFSAGAQAQAVPTLVKDSQKLVWVWMRLNARKMIEAAIESPRLAKIDDLDKIGHNFQECGFSCLVHFAFRQPISGTKSLIRIAQQYSARRAQKDNLGIVKAIDDIIFKELFSKIPSGMGMSFNVVEQDPGIQLALAAVYEKGGNVGWWSMLLPLIQNELKKENIDVQLHVEKLEKAELVRLGFNVDPRQMISDKLSTVSDENFSAVEIDQEAVNRQILRVIPMAQKYIEQLKGMRISKRFYERALVGEWTIELKNKPAFKPLDIKLFKDLKWQSPDLARELSQGGQCLAKMTSKMVEAFEALASTDPEMRNKLMIQVIENILLDVDCAINDPLTKQEAKKLKIKIYLQAAEYAKADNDQELQKQYLQKACQVGYKEACK
jgi:hypothetical protein